MLIWRPVFGGHVPLADVNEGRVCLMDILKLNALMDSREAAEQRALKRGREK